MRTGIRPIAEGRGARAGSLTPCPLPWQGRGWSARAREAHATRRLTWAVALAVALAGALAGATLAAAATEGGSATDTPPAAPLAGPVQTRLTNGLRLAFQNNPASPVVAICAFVHTTAAQEAFNGAGVRELLQIMGQRTLVRPDAPAEETPPVMDLDTSLSRDYVELLALCLPGEVPKVLERIRWALFEPYFSTTSYRFAQDQLREEVVSRQSLAPDMALDALVASLYPQWPGSWPLVGTGGATLVGEPFVQDFHARNYLINRCVLAVAGPLDGATLHGQVEQAFGNLLPGKPGRLLPPPVGAEAKSGPLELRLEGTEVAAVVAGGRGPSLVDPDYPAASVLVSILGTGHGSRLYHRLRVQEDLCYTIDAGVSPSQVCPYLYVAATCAPDKTRQTQAALTDELHKIVDQPPTEEEVARARRSLWGQYQLQQQDNEQMAHYLGVFALLDPEEGTAEWSALPLRLAAVRPEQVQQEARQYLATPMIVVVRGRPAAPETPEGR